MAFDESLARLENDVLVYMPERLRKATRAALRALVPNMLSGLSEIRIREGMPPTLICFGKEAPSPADDPYIVTRDDIARMFNLISANSVHAFEEELRQGYVTVKGGHRIGMAGKAVLEGGQVKTIKHVRSFNIRIARNCRGAAATILSKIISNGRPLSTLIAGPPSSGKTTVLRDLARSFSHGIDSAGVPPMNVGIVDERSEIAGCYAGIPQNDVGPRTDVLDACPKAEGMMMLIRAMSPNVLITDEIGTPRDATAILEALNSGVVVFASAHASAKTDLWLRPGLKTLLEMKAFQRLVILSLRHGPGTVEEICDGQGGTIQAGPIGGTQHERSGGA